MDRQEFMGFVLRNWLFSSEELLAQWNKEGNKEELDPILSAMNLERKTNRLELFWSLQAIAERAVLEASDDDGKLVQRIQSDWNALFPKWKLDSKHILGYVGFRSPTERNLFLSICDGDLSSYRLLADSPDIFHDLLNRFIISNDARVSQYDAQAEELIEMTLQNKVKNVESLRRTGFAEGSKLVGDFARRYRGIVKKYPPAFHDGLTVILKQIQSELEVDSKLSKLITDLITIKPKESLEPQGKKEQSTTVSANETPTVALEKKGDETSATQLEAIATEVIPTHNATVTQPSDLAVVEQLTIARQALESLAVMAQAATKKTQLQEESSVSVVELQKEIERLHGELAAERGKMKEMREQLVIQLVSDLGGQNSGYLLSQLYELASAENDDQVTLQQGIFVNLFSSLRLHGIEPLRTKQEIGHDFVVNREELGTRYMTDRSISPDEQHIQVRLLRYGWSYQGRVVVQPLVKIL